MIVSPSPNVLTQKSEQGRVNDVTWCRHKSMAKCWYTQKDLDGGRDLVADHLMGATLAGTHGVEVAFE